MRLVRKNLVKVAVTREFTFLVNVAVTALKWQLSNWYNCFNRQTNPRTQTCARIFLYLEVPAVKLTVKHRESELTVGLTCLMEPRPCNKGSLWLPCVKGAVAVGD